MNYELDWILTESGINDSTAAKLFGCTRQNIHQRRKKGDTIKPIELYWLYSHVLKLKQHNKVAFLYPKVCECFPEFAQSTRTLVQIREKPWKKLTLFLPTPKAALEVRELLRSDVRDSEKTRFINIYIPEKSNTFLDEIADLFDRQQCIRANFTFSLFVASDMNFLSALVLMDDEVLLQSAGTGFHTFGGESLQSHWRAVQALMEKHTIPKIGPKKLQFVGQSKKLAMACDGRTVAINFHGQLGGNYRLDIACDQFNDQNSGADTNDVNRWRMRLSTNSYSHCDRSIEIVNQAGQPIICTNSRNLPWQGFWPHANESPAAETDYLLISEHINQQV